MPTTNGEEGVEPPGNLTVTLNTFEQKVLVDWPACDG